MIIQKLKFVKLITVKIIIKKKVSKIKKKKKSKLECSEKHMYFTYIVTLAYILLVIIEINVNF